MNVTEQTLVDKRCWNNSGIGNNNKNIWAVLKCVTDLCILLNVVNVVKVVMKITYTWKARNFVSC